MAEAAARGRPRASSAARRALLELAALHRRQGEDSATRRSTNSRRSTASRSGTSRTSTTTRASSGRSRAQLRRGQSIGRDMIVMTDNSPYPALHRSRTGWVEKLDKSVIPNIEEPRRRGSGIPAGIRTATTACPGQSGMTGIGYNAKLTKPVTDRSTSCSTDKSLKGQGDAPRRDSADTIGAGHARERRRPRARSRTPSFNARDRRDPEGGRLGPDPRSSRATTTPACWPRATSGRASPGRATSSSCTPTTRT